MKAYRYKCPCCGKVFWEFSGGTEANHYNKEWQGHLCHDCANWLDYINADKPYMEILGGTCYDVLPPQKDVGPGDMLGGGHMRYILKKDGSTKKSNDIWKIGVVPSHMKNLFPNTGWWISCKNYRNLRFGWYQCDNKGCLDRYNCLRYDITKETEPYNIIPNDWSVGDEKCPIFVNTLEIEDYNGERPENTII